MLASNPTQSARTKQTQAHACESLYTYDAFGTLTVKCVLLNLLWVFQNICGHSICKWSPNSLSFINKLVTSCTFYFTCPAAAIREHNQFVFGQNRGGICLFFGCNPTKWLVLLATSTVLLCQDAWGVTSNILDSHCKLYIRLFWMSTATSVLGQCPCLKYTPCHVLQHYWLR